MAGWPLLNAKYKRRTSEARPYGDLYQMLAYCTALGLPTVHLVYADGDQSRNYVVHRAGTRIHTWIVDLTQPTSDILNQVGLTQHLLDNAEHT